MADPANPATPPADTATGASDITTGNVNSFLTTFGAGSTTDPSVSSPSANYGVSGAFNVTPIFKEPSRTLKFPDPSKLVTFIDRYLPRIKTKSGIATFTVFNNEKTKSEKKAEADAETKAKGDEEIAAKSGSTPAEKKEAAKSRKKADKEKNAGGVRQYRTINFFGQGVTIDRSESISIIKTNRGFTLYSPDNNPVGLTLTGTLLNGNDWGFGSDQASITHTDWVAKFLSDYDRRLSATAAIRNNQSIFFSFQNIYAEVHVVSIGTAVSSDDPLLAPLRVSMVCKELRVTYRPDVPDSGIGIVPEILKIFADLSAAGEKLAQIVASPPGAGFAKGTVTNFTPNVFFNTSSKIAAQNITAAAQKENLDAFLKLYTRPRSN